MSWSRHGQVGLLALGVVLLSGCGSDETTPTDAAVPAHLQILAASVESRRGSGDVDRAARPVTIRLVMAAEPPCAGDPGFELGVLVDADADLGTGETGEAFEGLGVDAKLAIRCVGGRLTSDVGAVTVAPADAVGKSVELRVATTVADLPSLRFRWVAYAHDGADGMVRLPEAPHASAWELDELWTY